MIKKKYLKKLDNYVKILSCILILFLIVWFSSKSLVYSITSQVPTLYILTGNDKINTAEVLKKAANLDTFNYKCPVEFVKEKEVQCINVKKGQKIELQNEKINYVKAKKINTSDIYFKMFTGLDKSTMKDVKILDAKTKGVTSIIFKVPEEPGEYTYQIVIRYDKKNIDYVFRIRVGE